MRRESATISRGFTLLELVLVLLVIAIAAATVAPSLRGWTRGQQARDSAEQFVALTRWARSQAITQSATYRMTIDPTSGSYQLTLHNPTTGEFAALGSSWGRTFNVPEGTQIELSDPPGGTSGSAINFYPTGRIDPAKIRITSQDGDRIEIECVSPGEGFVVAQTARGS